MNLTEHHYSAPTAEFLATLTRLHGAAAVDRAMTFTVAPIDRNVGHNLLCSTDPVYARLYDAYVATGNEMDCCHDGALRTTAEVDAANHAYHRASVAFRTYRNTNVHNDS